jgi:phosphate transport system protein
MPRHIQRQIEAVKRRLLEEGTLVEEAVVRAVAAYLQRDTGLAQRVIRDDEQIDQLEVDLEEECLKTLALYQPVAADLRFVVALLKINNDLERMGDLAKNIAKRARFLNESEAILPPADVQAMAERVQSMIKGSLDALVNSDTRLAREVRDQDDEVDTMRKRFHILIEDSIRQSPERSAQWMSLDAIIKHLERLADMATNIAEDVIYMVEGDIVRHHAGP